VPYAPERNCATRELVKRRSKVADGPHQIGFTETDLVANGFYEPNNSGSQGGSDFANMLFIQIN
jgi:hypothetical protein